MKNLILIFALALGFVACEGGEEGSQHQGSYSCSIDVTNLNTQSTERTGTAVECEIDEEGNSVYEITLEGVSFTSTPMSEGGMPPMDISFYRMRAVVAESGEVTFVSTEEPIVPIVNDTPRPDFQIQELVCFVENSGRELNLSFKVVNQTPPFNLNHKVVAQGVLIERD